MLRTTTTHFQTLTSPHMFSIFTHVMKPLRDTNGEPGLPLIEQKKQGWFYSREYKFFVTNISEGTAFLLKGLTYNDEVKLRRYNLKNRLFFRSFFFVTLVPASNLPWVSSHAALWKYPRRGPVFFPPLFCKWAKVFPRHPCESGFGRFCMGWFFPCPSLPRGFWTCSVATKPRTTANSIRSLSEVLVAFKGGMFQFTET